MCVCVCVCVCVPAWNEIAACTCRYTLKASINEMHSLIPSFPLPSQAELPECLLSNNPGKSPTSETALDRYSMPDEKAHGEELVSQNDREHCVVVLGCPI